MRLSYVIVFLTAILVAQSLASSASAGILYSSDFNANDGGLTEAHNDNAFVSLGDGDRHVPDGTFTVGGPWTYDGGVGVMQTGGWFTNGQSAETSGNVYDEDGNLISLGPGAQFNTTRLTTPVLTVTAFGPVTLSFDHRYSFEYDGQAWDGGAVFLKVNGGDFEQVPLLNFIDNGYNGIVDSTSGSELANQWAFVSTSAAYDTRFLTTIANLGTFSAGDKIEVQFVGAFDRNTQGEFLPNWEIDNLNITDAATRAHAPEPATLTMWGLVSLGCAIGACRRRKNSAGSLRASP